MPSPAERYAAARAQRSTPQLGAFRQSLAFDLDPFQRTACEALERGRSVLVAAPTGAGKTVVAEFAVHLTMQEPGAKLFYTTPMKALSNQKFQELAQTWGAGEVGLLTGDTSVNPQARIVVMTTEVLRNMIYSGSALLDELAFVVMDEVHYLADRFRGPVWEEVIIQLPSRVRLVSLSATVSNAEEFGDWMQTVRGDTEVVVSEHRPVPLDHHVLLRKRLLPLFARSGRAGEGTVNAELPRIAGTGRPRGKGGGRPPRPADRFRVNRYEIVELLDEEDLLPAIFFIFSRAGCDAAVAQVVASGIRLTTPEERAEIRAIADERTEGLPDEDLGVLGYWEWLEGLQRGVAAHHAGLLPVFKEVVEELFRRRLLRVVFATETLALGINMPARSVVLERLEKFNGEARVPITAGEYTQLTGRAGRRGIDVEGHSVIIWREGMEPHAVAALASRRSYPLNSAFRPSYNMAVNLIDQHGRARAREILESSFAQFQSDRSVVELARKVRAQEESIAAYAESMRCDRGDFAEYAAIRRELRARERAGDRAATLSAAQRRERAAELERIRGRLRAHPCHSCPDREEHARWADRWWRLREETDRTIAHIRSRTDAIARRFDRVTAVLVRLGYLDGEGDGVTVTEAGARLKRIYGERDLIVAECLRRDAWSSVDAAGLAAVACTLVYEERSEDVHRAERNVPGAFREAFQQTLTAWADVSIVEEDGGLPETPRPSAGIAVAMLMWARGERLDRVLREGDLVAGDFVRWAKQTADLLGQISGSAEGRLAGIAREAIDRVQRGVVVTGSSV